MKKWSFLFLTVFALSGMLQAKPVDVERAKMLGVKFMNTNTTAKSSQAELTYTAVADNGMACCYVFSVHPKGFVIVAADDRMKPILGYSTESNFTAQLPDGLMTFFDNYKAGFAQMVENKEVRTEQAIADWTRLAETGRLTDARTSRGVEPLLASIWNQTDLYNNMTPEDPSSVFGGHCKSGCVANTMSQIMRYWEWPRHGIGGHGYDAHSQYGNYGWVEANFEDATYRFELMPDFLDFASPQAEVDATALLEFHAGVSVDMMYGANASGAYSDDVGPAMQGNFRYSSDWQHLSKSQYSATQWENMLRNNLDDGMPLYYASQGEASGHAYALDGYDDNNMFHLNWGWAGFDNGWYAIDGFYLTYYSFPWWHNAIFDLHPNDAYYDAPMEVSGLEVEDALDWIDIDFDINYLTRNGDPIASMDTVVIMRDGQIIRRYVDYTISHFYTVDFDVEKGGTYYYAVYVVNEAGMSKVARDTVTVGPSCDLRFELADSGNNGWDMSFIAVLDEDGKVSQRVGLWDGGEASVTVPVPSDQTITLFWTYDNTCYTHGSLSEVSYEVYDWADHLIVASDGYPEVGEIIDYETTCRDCHPVDRLDAEYQWTPEGYGVALSWDWSGASFDDYRVYRDDMLVYATSNPDNKQYFDANPPLGASTYSVAVRYQFDHDYCVSDKVFATVEVTSVDELNAAVTLYPNPATNSFAVQGNVKEISVFDVLGQRVYQGLEPVVDVAAWPEGVYFVRIVDGNGTVSTVKLLKQ